jgi:hypothetical protein
MEIGKKAIVQMQKIAEKEGYKEISVNIRRKTPLTIEGIKGHFVPEILCYIEGEMKAIITFIKSLEKEEFFKLTSFIDFANKNNLSLYITYDEQKISQEKIVQKFIEEGVEISKNMNIIAISV